MAKTTKKFHAFAHNRYNDEWKELTPIGVGTQSYALMIAYEYVHTHPKQEVYIYCVHTNTNGDKRQSNLGKVRKSNTTGKIIWIEYNKKNIDSTPTYYFLDNMGYRRGKVLTPFERK